MSSNGGPAFPTAPEQMWDGDREQQIGERPGKPGMSLRDYFAARAVGALATHSLNSLPLTDLGNAPELCAGLAYRIADAMLAERAKVTP